MSTSTLAPSTDIGHDEYVRLAKLARLLSWASLVIVGAEGLVGITAGIAASSIALIGFGIDSVIEGLASLIMVWRFTGARITSNAAELRAQRLVAWQFFILAPYIAVEATRDLWTGAKPDVSWIGIGLAVFSLLSMPLLGRAKQSIGRRMGSISLQGEGSQNMLCAMMAAALLIGLLGNAALGLWWLDPVAGIAIACLAVREGMNTWRGQSCCVPIKSESANGDDCNTGCC
jgi:divalent metal cation (Fe/Co/Zn/Cd) transporter